VRTFVIVIHTIASFGLIFFVLLQSGKGGGLSEAFGGGGIASTFSSSSIVEKNLDRITIGLAIIFAVTTLILLKL
jgi:preprotein translocase subunit SecG